MKSQLAETPIKVVIGNTVLEGDWCAPLHPQGIIVFAHGSGSSRHSSRNRYVASVLNQGHFSTLLFDLLTSKEEAWDEESGELRFNIPFLAKRLVGVTDWLLQQSMSKRLPIGYFGASTGGGAALQAAVERPEEISAVVSRGGRPDLARAALPQVHASTLLIVGERDVEVLECNAQALDQIPARHKRLAIVSGATHLFEEPGALEQVAALATTWFQQYLKKKEEVKHHVREIS